MWILTNFGFFSIVQKPSDAAAQRLTVRARVRSDLEALKLKHLPQASQIHENAGSDYRYRMTVKKTEFAAALHQIALNIDYSNFKDSVAEQQGAERAKLYHELWEALYKLQEANETENEKNSSAPKATRSYGGVLFNDCGQVLLRKPLNEFDGYAWTFAKGLIRPGEAPEETAAREVREKTGYQARILGKIPGSYIGGTSCSEYFIMAPISEPRTFACPKTQALVWVSFTDAHHHICETRNEAGQKRDLAVLAAAVREYQRILKNGA